MRSGNGLVTLLWMVGPLVSRKSPKNPQRSRWEEDVFYFATGLRHTKAEKRMRREDQGK
jgi:hypothetical protein